MSQPKSKTPRYGRLVKSAKEFWESANDIVHVAFKRANGLYFHHSIISSYFDAEWNVYEYFMAFKNIFTGPGEVGKNKVSRSKIEQAIKKGQLYVIEAPYYPKTETEKKIAKQRFWGRWEEKLYSVASNNCEHLVNYILTGNPFSEQIQNAGVWKKAIVDCFDTVVSRGKRAMLKMSGCQIATLPAHYFVETAVEEVLKVATNVMLTQLQFAPSTSTAGQCAENICNVASKTSQLTKAQLLASNECLQAAEVASKQALEGTIGITFVVSAVIESGFALYDINKFKKQRDQGIITERDFKRETTKAVGGAVCAIAGTVAGGAVGQALYPYPVLGFALGSAMGNGVGRIAVNVLFGFVFDHLYFTIRTISMMVPIIPAQYSVTEAAGKVLNVATEVLPIQSPSTWNGPVENIATGICNVASQSSSKFTKAQLLASKECVEAAEIAGNQAINETAASTLVVSAVVEGGFAAYNIYKLNKKRKRGIISKKEFKRETTKTVGGAVFATGGSVAGGVIGQAFCPYPVIGFAIGSATGNGVGRISGNIFSGFVFDHFNLIIRSIPIIAATIPAHYFVKVAAGKVLNVATQVLTKQSPSTWTGPVENIAKGICNVASQSSSKFTKAQLLASKECVEAAEIAGNQAIYETAASTLVVSAVVEGGFAAYDIYKLNQKRKKGIISKRDFKLETTKTVGGAVCATGGSFAGGIIGQAFCPIPVLGFALGSTIGNVVGRTVGNSLFGFLFNKLF